MQSTQSSWLRHTPNKGLAQLAAQVERNRAAARSRLVDEASDDEG